MVSMLEQLQTSFNQDKDNTILNFIDYTPVDELDPSLGTFINFALKWDLSSWRVQTDLWKGDSVWNQIGRR